MGKYNLVLVAKGSKIGRKAAEEAAKIAKSSNIKTIHILFINDASFYSGEGLAYVKEDLRRSLENIGNTIISNLSKIIKNVYPEVKTEKIELTGKTADQIMNFINSNKVQILIIPRDKRGPIERSLVGGAIAPFFDKIREKTKLIIVE